MYQKILCIDVEAVKMVRRMPKDSITKIVPQRGREIFDLISALLERLEWKCSSQGVN
jgi:hypothetical protein